MDRPGLPAMGHAIDTKQLVNKNSHMDTDLHQSQGGKQEMKDERMKRLYVWIPLKLFADIQYQANMSGLSVAEYVIDALTEKLRRDSDEK